MTDARDAALKSLVEEAQEMGFYDPPRAPANRAELVEVMARAIAWAALTPHGRSTCVWPDSFSEMECLAFRHGAETTLAALEAAGARVVPAEATEEMHRRWHLADDYFESEWAALIAASPYAPEAGR